LRRGYTIVWSGWDPDAPRANSASASPRRSPPKTGEPIVEIVRDEFVSGTRGGASRLFKLSYEMATSRRARLTVRERQADPRRGRLEWPVDADRSSWPTAQAAAGLPSTSSTTRHQAQGAGLGFAATRDFVSFCATTSAAARRPAGRSAMRWRSASRQAGRYLRQPHLGRLQPRREGRRVFDGIHSHIAGIGRIFFNMPFCPAGAHQHPARGHSFPERLVPLHDRHARDPLTEQRGSLLRGDG
jgi:hypothetical protein